MSSIMLFCFNKMRRSAVVFFLSASILLPNFAFSRHLTSQEALNRCFPDDGRCKITGSKGEDYMQAAVIRDDYGMECVYVFNNIATPGFMIVSADDCARPLLAYSEADTLDLDNLPPALRAWIDGYADEIGRYVSSGASERFVKESRSQLPTISPIIKSQWNQNSPYNDKCPIYSGSERCFTGCVATAAAQIMYRYKYPSKGVGSFSYTDEINGQNRTLSADFGNTKYDWASMTDKYTKNSSAKSKAAVATLMSHLGVAFKMDYDFLDINQSGANLYNAAIGLIDYFSYSKGIRYLASKYFSTDEWKRIVHDELSNGRPLLYEGRSDKSGHAFVCDGYNQTSDKFHFNWGWGGNGDGYYSLSALKPQVSGGTAGGGDYNYTDSQAAIFGIAVPSGNNDYMAVVTTYGDLTVSPTLTNFNGSVTMGMSDSEYPAFFNYVASNDTQTFQFGLRLKSTEDGSEYIISSESEVELEPLYGTYTVSVSLSGVNIPEGTYTATPIVRIANESESGNWNTVYIEDGREDSLTMKVGKHYVKAYNSKTTECVPEVSDISCPEETTTGRQFTVKATVEAKYADYQGEIIVKTMTPTNDTEVIGISDYATIPKGEKRTIEIPCTALRLSGESLDLCVADNNHRVFYDASEIRIIVGEPEFSFLNADLPEDLSIREEYIVSGLLEVRNAPYTGNVVCKAFDDSETEISTSESAVEVTLSAGHCTWLDFDMPAIEDAGTYHFAAFEVGGKKIADIPGEIRVYCPQFKLENASYPAVVKQNDSFSFDFDITNIGERAYNGYINYVIESADETIKNCDWTNYEVLAIAPEEKQSIQSYISTYNVACAKYNISFFVTKDCFATEGIDTGYTYPLEIVNEWGGITETTGENMLIEVRPTAVNGAFEVFRATAGDRIIVYDATGAIIYNQTATIDNPIININPVSSGLYIVKCRDCAIKIIIKQ